MKRFSKRGENERFFQCNFFRKNSRGELLTENIVFISLNVVFLTILFLFLFSKMGGAAILEEKYAKQIALIIDSSKPPLMEIRLNMEDAIKKAKSAKFTEPIVRIDGNIVTVKLREEGNGYSYSFFNNVDVNAYPERDLLTNKFTGMYIFIINEK